MTPGMALSGQMSMGGSQPPKNRIDIMAHIRTMLTYSARKKSRNGVEEYSTLKPATSSDSASGRSKGGRLVSASAEMKNSTNIGSRGENTNQPRISGAWARTMADRFNEPANNSTVTRKKPMEPSKETICAAERSPPRNQYWKLEAHPPMMIPKPPSEEMAKK